MVHLVHESGSAASKTSTLRYLMRSTSGGWGGSVVDKTSSTNTGHHCSMVLDAMGGLHVAYHDEGNADLRHAYRAAAGTTWTLQSVHSVGSVGQHPSVVVGNKGAAHIVFNAAGKLSHASKSAGGTWSVKAVGTASSTTGTGLAQDASGGLHAAFQSGSDLAYATLSVCP